jgi:hypothetical protein
MSPHSFLTCNEFSKLAFVETSSFDYYLATSVSLPCSLFVVRYCGNCSRQSELSTEQNLLFVNFRDSICQRELKCILI